MTSSLRFPSTKISALVSDVDGTLVTDDKRLTARAKAAVAELRASRIIFAIISSRAPRGLRAAVMLYALTHEELRARLVTLNAEIYKRMAKDLTKAFRRPELPMPLERLIPTLHALSDGLTFLRALMPELVSDAVIVAAFDALAGATTRK